MDSEVKKSAVCETMKKLDIDHQNYEPYCLTQTELEQISIFCEALIDLRDDEETSECARIKKRVHQLLAQASLKCRLDERAATIQKTGHELLDTYNIQIAQYKVSQDFYKERIEKIKSESEPVLLGESGQNGE